MLAVGAGHNDKLQLVQGKKTQKPTTKTPLQTGCHELAFEKASH